MLVCMQLTICGNIRYLQSTISFCIRIRRMATAVLQENSFKSVILYNQRILDICFKFIPWIFLKNWIVPMLYIFQKKCDLPQHRFLSSAERMSECRRVWAGSLASHSLPRYYLMRSDHVIVLKVIGMFYEKILHLKFCWHGVKSYFFQICCFDLYFGWVMSWGILISIKIAFLLYLLNCIFKQFFCLNRDWQLCRVTPRIKGLLQQP